MALDPICPIIRLGHMLATPAPTSVPDAVSRALATRYLRPIPVDRDGRPPHRWWLEVAADVRRECARFIEAFEPNGTLHVGPQVSPGAPWEWLLAIQLVTRPPLEVRVFTVHFEHGGALRLQPFSESAVREAWRSLYAPEPTGGRGKIG